MARKKTKSIPLSGMKYYQKSGDAEGIVTAEVFDEAKRDRIRSWVTFYRNNISFFIEHYMGVILFPYQRFWVTLMSRSTKFLGIASRASAKSWLIAVYSIARCILYPGTTVILASSTKAQAGLIISDKCKALYDEHPNIRRECSNLTTNMNKWEMEFYNGSKIKVVVSGEGARGNRSNVTVLEERRLIPSEIIDSIIRPFRISRQAPYMKLPEYSEIEELREESLEIIITSAHYKSYEWYPEAKKLLRQIASGNKDVRAIFFDYLITLKHGIKTKKQIIEDKRDFNDPIAFLMEYGNIPYGSSSASFYKLGLFNRSIKRSWRPMTDEMFITGKRNPYDIEKLINEERIVSVDVAMRAGRDNTIVTCARLLPNTKKGWETEVVYMESYNGKRTDDQTLRIKRIFEEFRGDTLVLDLLNAGISVFDGLSSITHDEIRGEDYPSYTVIRSDLVDNSLYDELVSRTKGRDAIPCIYPILATGDLNTRIAVKFKERMRNKLIKYLVDDNEEEEFLIKSGNKDILDQYDSEVRAYLLQAHLQTTLFINESISLDMNMINGKLKLEQPEGTKKDRYTSVSYLNYYVSLMDLDLLKEVSGETDEQAFLEVARVF